MKIEPKHILIKDLYKGYVNDNEEGVIGYNGKLDIRPRYQREWIYSDKKRDAVLKTVRKSFPLNSIYWVKNKNGTFEVLDGQQRTISICEYLDGSYSINSLFFHNLQKNEQDQILNYKLMVYFCEGNDKEKLDWFETINIAGEKLFDQELKNAIYSGPWLTDAKRYFSKTGCPAYSLANNYMKGKAIRQDYLETVIKWISEDKIKDYMAKNQNKSNSNDLKKYFNEVISWTKSNFLKYRPEMKGVEFGYLYNEFKNKKLNPDILEKEISKLMEDEDIQKRSGIYSYVLKKNIKDLNLRAFPEKTKQTVYERQKGKCLKCKKDFDYNQLEGDHIKQWADGGKTNLENCQMLCSPCHKEVKMKVR